jgi:gamma-glutamyltranspeptidase / glutathione hydrolase
VGTNGVPAGVAASHSDTAAAGLAVLADGGTAADAAVAAVLACSATESIYTGLGGGGFATYFEAATGTVTCLDFFCTVPGTDGDVVAAPMVPIPVTFGGIPQVYAIGGASVAVPGVPAGCGEVHRRWGRLPWRDVVAPAVEAARTGVVLLEAHARTLAACAPALAYGEGAACYQPGGVLLAAGDRLHHPGLDAALLALADDGPATFYTGDIAKMIVDAVRGAGGALGPADLATFRVVEQPIERACLAGHEVCGRRDMNRLVDTVAALPADLRPPARAVPLAVALRDRGFQRLGETTNVSVVDPAGNACVITTTLGLGAAVWLPGLGVNMNSMLGEGELVVGDLTPGTRMQSNMCPLVVLDGDGALALAAGSAGASRIRSALVQTLLGVLVDGLPTPAATARPRLHVVEDTVHAEAGYPEDELGELEAAGWAVRRWDGLNHYFGGVTAVGVGGAGGDPRRGGIGLTL